MDAIRWQGAITEMVDDEDLGCAHPGEGWKVATSGVTRPGGELPVTTSAGLTSQGA
jgi:acetyl-CoA acetyltransferase